MVEEQSPAQRARAKPRAKSPTAVAFGQALQQAEQDLGWTPAQAAEALELNLKTYFGYRSGQRKPSLRLLPRFAEVLHKSLYFFLGLPDPAGLSHQAHTLGEIYDRIEDPVLRDMVLEVARSNLRIDERRRRPGE